MLITVILKPNARHREEVVVSGGTYTVYTKAPAIEGQANTAAIKLLAKHFRLSRGRIRLVRGAKSKRKVFMIDK